MSADYHNRSLSESKQERWIVFILAAMQFFHVLDFVIMMPLGPFFMKEFSIGSTEFGFLVSSYTFSAGLFGFFGAFFLEKWERKKSLLFVFLGFSLATIFCSISFNYYQLLIARSIAGGFGGLTGALILALIGDIIPYNRRGKVTGIVLSAFSLASIIGIPLGMLLAENYSWKLSFFSIGLFSIVVFFLARGILPKGNENPIGNQFNERIQIFIKMLLDKQILKALFFMICLMFAGFTLIPFITPYMVANVGLALDELKYIYLVGGMVTFFTTRRIGRMADSLGKFNVFTVVAILSWIPILWLTHLGKSSLWIALTCTTFFMVLVSGRLVPAFAIITACASKEVRASFMSLNSAVQQLSSGLASLLAGIIIQESENSQILYNYDIVGWIAIVFSLISIMIARTIQPKEV